MNESTISKAEEVLARLEGVSFKDEQNKVKQVLESIGIGSTAEADKIIQLVYTACLSAKSRKESPHQRRKDDNLSKLISLAKEGFTAASTYPQKKQMPHWIQLCISNARREKHSLGLIMASDEFTCENKQPVFAGAYSSSFPVTHTEFLVLKYPEKWTPEIATEIESRIK